MNKYIALDVETGGLGSDTSLLTAYLAILDQNLNITSDLYLNVKPDDGIYKVKGDAMKINGIDLSKHNDVAITYKAAGTLLYNFIKSAYDNTQKINSDNTISHSQLIPLGQNVKFDIVKVTDSLISQAAWNQFVSYRCLDTAVIAGFLIQCGKLPATLNAGLQSMAEHFGVGKQEDFGHDAKHDVELTIGVYRALLKIGQL